jgi:hypothetical protein
LNHENFTRWLYRIVLWVAHRLCGFAELQQFIVGHAPESFPKPLDIEASGIDAAHPLPLLELSRRPSACE